MPQKQNTSSYKNGVERRITPDRRKTDRRSLSERRRDSRLGDNTNKQKKTLKTWFRSISRARLGVDRRKGERRSAGDRRQQLHDAALLTQEELNDLLS